MQLEQGCGCTGGFRQNASLAEVPFEQLFGARVHRLLLLVSLLLLVCGWQLRAQTQSPNSSSSDRPYDFYARGPYRSGLPRPTDYFGYDTGEFLTTYALYESLLREYETHSDRLRVFTIGKTPEHRTQYLLAISSPRNLAHLDDIKQQLGNLADPRKLKTGPELDQLLQNLPIVIWLSYSIHGSESAAFEAGIQVLYQLIASDDRAITEALDHSVVLINPCQNPDGHERFATWYNAHGAGRSEPYAFEHREPWSITGRLNHNFFDLNRDLVSLSQPESQAATKAFLEWHPQVLADHHGQTKEYFFPPPALPINPNLPQKTALKWLEIFGKSNAEVFDKQEWPYFVRERFDLFYPGYWDSWSSLHGATGMTYETDGGGPLGYRWSRDDGTILTLRGGIAKHVAADVATVITAATNREARLRDYRDFFESTLNELKRKFYLVPGQDPQGASDLVALLQRQGIEVSRSNREIKLLNAADYFGNPPGERTIPPGSFIVDTAQPYGRIATALLETETPEDSAFVQRQESLRKANEAKGSQEIKQDYEFYDVTAWSLPLAMGVEAYYSDEPVPTDTKQFGALSSDPTGASGPQKAPAEADLHLIELGVAYTFQPASAQAMRMAIQLLRQGYRIDTCNNSFRAANTDLPRGTFILWDERNPANLRESLTRLAHEDGVPVQTIHSSFPGDGMRGIGSESDFPLKCPKVAILADDPVGQTSYGLLRFILDEKYGLDVIPVPLASLDRDAYDQINVLILPDGEAARYKKVFEESQLNDLRDWINHGGVLICIGGASEFAADPDTKLAPARIVGGDTKPDASDTGQKSDHSSSPKKEGADRRPIEIPGAIVNARVNRNNFLTIGYESDTLPLFIEGDILFKPSETGANVLTFKDDKLKISGFFWEGDSEQVLRGSCALIDEPTQSGNLILFAFEPGFRMIWSSTVRLLLNAIVYGPSQPQNRDN
jgi:hypothetical protein